MLIKKFPSLGIKIFLTEHVLGFKHIKNEFERVEDLERESMELEQLMNKPLIVMCPDGLIPFHKHYGKLYFNNEYDTLTRQDAKNQLHIMTFDKKIKEILNE